MPRPHLIFGKGVLGAVLLALGLAACEEQQAVKRRAYVTPQMLMEFQATGGLLVELHGMPWPSASANEAVATLRMPAGVASDLRFRPIKPGGAHIGGGQRLVLHFNALQASNPVNNCTAKAPFETGAGEDEFTVSATFCEGGQWVVHAFMEGSVSEQDWLGYFQSMQGLFGAMFPNR